MAPLPVITDIFRCTLRWQHSSGQHAVNVIHVKDEAGGSTELEVFNTLDNTVTQSMWDWISTGASVVGVDIIKLDGTSATQSFATGSPAKWTGNGGSEFMPALAGLIKEQTSIRGRSYRGRIFLPFISEQEQVNGALTPDLAAVQAAWSTFRDDLEAISYPLVVASYKLAVANQVTAVTAEGVGGTQRRRQSRLR